MTVSSITSFVCSTVQERTSAIVLRPAESSDVRSETYTTDNQNHPSDYGTPAESLALKPNEKRIKLTKDLYGATSAQGIIDNEFVEFLQ